MRLLSLVFVAVVCAAGCGDDSPAGGSNTGGSSAGGEAAGGAPSAGAPGDGGSGGVAEGGAAPQGLCVDTAAAGECPELTGCPGPGEALCGCSAAQEGEFCQLQYNGQGEGCGFGANCIEGVWVEEKI